MVRVLVRELGIECAEVAITEFPPAPAYFAINPLGQVPALETEDGTRFPTKIILDYLIGLPRTSDVVVAGSVRRSGDRWQDEQCLAVLLAMGDALATMKYQGWAGLGPVGENLIGFDPADRHRERVQKTLDWLENAAQPSGFIPGVLSVQDIALACIILWTEARGSIRWRGRPRLEAIVENCAGRPSFVATTPQIWP